MGADQPGLELLPAVDVSGGRAVRLVQGEAGTETSYGAPLEAALAWQAAGATWVSFHHGGGVGIGFSLHAGMVVVADGTPEAAARLERVLTTDPGMGVLRHADAGYRIAVDCAAEQGLDLPMVGA